MRASWSATRSNWADPRSIPASCRVARSPPRRSRPSALWGILERNRFLFIYPFRAAFSRRNSSAEIRCLFSIGKYFISNVPSAYFFQARSHTLRVKFLISRKFSRKRWFFDEGIKEGRKERSLPLDSFDFMDDILEILKERTRMSEKRKIMNI